MKDRDRRPLHILQDKKSSSDMFEKQNQCFWQVDHIISHFFTELKIYHHSLFITHITISTLLIWAVCRTHVIHEPCIWPSSPWHKSFITHWLGHRTSVQKVTGSIPFRNSDFFFVLCLWYLDHIISHFSQNQQIVNQCQQQIIPSILIALANSNF